jgi:hypothetical protein
MSSIPHFRTDHTNDSTGHTGPSQPPDQGGQIARRTRYREWADYGAPPLLPLRPPTAAEVRQALLQRSMSPTQTNVAGWTRSPSSGPNCYGPGAS